MNEEPLVSSSVHSSLPTARCHIDVQVDGSIYVIYNVGDGADREVVDESLKVSDGNFHVIRFVRTESNSSLQIDGNPILSVPHAATAATAPGKPRACTKSLSISRGVGSSVTVRTSPARRRLCALSIERLVNTVRRDITVSVTATRRYDDVIRVLYLLFRNLLR